MSKYTRQLTNAEIQQDVHRKFGGGMWDEIGPLQFDFLKERGLRPAHNFLDIGCGALRGGIHFIKYLERGNYYGVDINASLIDAGRVELAKAGLTQKEPHLVLSDRFDLQQFGKKFEFLLALSLFTHLFSNQILRCLAAVRDVLAPAGKFFATFFVAPHSLHLASIVHEPGGVRTEYDRDPFHYSTDEIRAMAKLAALSVEIVGDWNHPRAQ